MAADMMRHVYFAGKGWDVGAKRDYSGQKEF